MECKYLNIGEVGCFFLPSKMCCLVETGPKKTGQESLYFDFSKLTERGAALSIHHSPLRGNRLTAARSEDRLDPHEEIHFSPDMWYILLALF